MWCREVLAAAAWGREHQEVVLVLFLTQLVVTQANFNPLCAGEAKCFCVNDNDTLMEDIFSISWQSCTCMRECNDKVEVVLLLCEVIQLKAIREDHGIFVAAFCLQWKQVFGCTFLASQD